MALAASALLFAGSAVTAPAAPEVALLARHELLSGSGASLQPSTEPARLARSLLLAGAAPSQVRVPDLSGMGFALVGGTAQLEGAGPGTAVVYERDGQRFVCQILAHLDGGGEVVASATVGGTHLRAYQGEGEAVVVWRDHGIWCAFSGPVGAEELLAMVSSRLESQRG